MVDYAVRGTYRPSCCWVVGDSPCESVCPRGCCKPSEARRSLVMGRVLMVVGGLGSPSEQGLASNRRARDTFHPARTSLLANERIVGQEACRPSTTWVSAPREKGARRSPRNVSRFPFFSLGGGERDQTAWSLPETAYSLIPMINGSKRWPLQTHFLRRSRSFRAHF